MDTTSHWYRSKETPSPQAALDRSEDVAMASMVEEAKPAWMDAKFGRTIATFQARSRLVKARRLSQQRLFGNSSMLNR